MISKQSCHATTCADGFTVGKGEELEGLSLPWRWAYLIADPVSASLMAPGKGLRARPSVVADSVGSLIDAAEVVADLITHRSA
jgi:hypothetical protein